MVTTNPKKPQEITITRRLYRSGESEYLVNGKQARLRDIQDLFMGTGLGPESYAIIEQGRIGQILSSKPGDRRAVIEEAAGITRFKTKRRLAEAKLEGAKQNLTRVFDILEEVGRQVNSLKRQAAKAKRYEELKSEMVGQLRRSLTGRFRMLERDAAKTALDLSAASSELETFTTQVAEKDREQKASQEQCFKVEAELTEARKALSELKLDAERTRSRLEYQAKQIGTIEQRLGQGGERNAGTGAARRPSPDRPGRARPQAERARTDRRGSPTQPFEQERRPRPSAKPAPHAAAGHGDRPPAGAAPAGRSLHAEESTGPGGRIPGLDGP